MQGMWPQKIMELDRLIHVGENVFSIDGVDVPASSTFTDAYDGIIGVGRKQRKLVKEASGETGLANYRNYINVASNIQKRKSVLVIASPLSRQLERIIPIVDEYISPVLFLDFAEMMAEETRYVMSDMKFSNSSLQTITITYTDSQGRTHIFGPGEDFMMDGFYLTWTPYYVELGHYYERLVCMNGQMVSQERKDAVKYRLSSDTMRSMINMVENRDFIARGVEKFGRLFSVASTSRISLSEMGRAQKILIAHGVDEKDAEALVPFNKVRSAYEDAGYYNIYEERLMKGEGTIWDTYNSLTRFATHTTIWDRHDYRRINIMNEAVNMLKRQPDILNYIELG